MSAITKSSSLLKIMKKKKNNHYSICNDNSAGLSLIDSLCKTYSLKVITKVKNIVSIQ